MQLDTVDWATLPAPVDDGGASHLPGLRLPDVTLVTSDGSRVRLTDLRGTTVIYAYPMTGQPDGALPDGWDDTPGARGCTPQSCAFRDHHAELSALGVDHLFGLSVQDTAYQAEAASRLHLPYPLLSDHDLALTHQINLPTMQVDGQTLLKRCTLICRDGVIVTVNYPVFPPDQDPQTVMTWLADNPA